ncbi:hypothetical protein J7E38_22555 [Bacillus sp. ISL-35]|uniref:hypothetical protein n=1 Tax=Bacillus sp. ISL-35 TaxID=2819122 RepID=UPI001BE86199|nr:hypothetical protein [Bacillus sp. ISL-35]MBT2681743.1 hypothetical protein [Bacillus sp. ISL-35]MBT2706040.1 hypothetical protein [Chryseobacterium sp. ISL-80]
MAKQIVFFVLSAIFFFIYIKVFDYVFRYIESSLLPYGLLVFIFQIFFAIVILFPASIVTTRKIFEVIKE